MRNLKTTRQRPALSLAAVAKRLGRILFAFNAACFFRLFRQNIGKTLQDLDRLFYDAPPFERLSDIKEMVARFCAGKGLEIGPGSTPVCDPARTVFADKFSYWDTSFPIVQVDDASRMPFADDSFDYVFSAHVLEHCPDTISALLEQIRVLGKGGRLVLVLPHGLRTFDAGRNLTSLDHHIEDYKKRADILDDTDWKSFEELSIPSASHIWTSDPNAFLADGAPNKEWILANGCYHYHVWTEREMERLLVWMGLEVVFKKPLCAQRRDSFAVVAIKPDHYRPRAELSR